MKIQSERSRQLIDSVDSRQIFWPPTCGGCETGINRVRQGATPTTHVSRDIDQAPFHRRVRSAKRTSVWSLGRWHANELVYVIGSYATSIGRNRAFGGPFRLRKIITYEEAKTDRGFRLRGESGSGGIEHVAEVPSHACRYNRVAVREDKRAQPYGD